MKSNTNKGIFDITYNHLNLPVEINFDEYSSIPSILYKYDATGVKLEKNVMNEGTISTQYAGGFIYNNNGGDQELQFFSHPEGYVEPVSGTPRSVESFEIGLPGPTYSSYKYVFQYKDHLGNVRLSYTDSDLNGSISPDEIIEESNYYPFGLKQKGYNNIVNGTENNYQTFLGQELNKELGLNWLTFRYRNYMPEIGRFFGVDPVSEDYMSISTYQFAHNNPIWKIELEGLEGIPVNGFDQMNHEPVTGHTNVGNSAIPIGDSTAGNYGSIYQTLSSDGSAMYASYPGESLDNLVTAGIQWLASELTGSDVSTETAGNIEMATNAIIFVSSKFKNGKAASELTEQVVKSEAKVTSRAARREAMRKEGIPTSQQAKSQSKNASGREYTYDTPKKGGSTETKSVQQQTMDRSHKDQPHWEAGKVKTDNGNVRTNNYGRPKLQNDKKKVDYDN